MIELQKRYSVFQRRKPLMVINMVSDPTSSEATAWIIDNFGKDIYLKICKQVDESNNTDYTLNYLIADNYNKNYELVSTWDEVIKKCCNFSMFDKKEKSSFPYWFAHWCAFQLCALNLKHWKFKYLFHDFEKPWMKLFCPYKEIQKWHREHNKHHLEYGLKHGFDKIDWFALMIDWECSHMSKKQCPLNAREEMENKLSEEKWKPYEKEIRKRLEPLLNMYFM